MGITHDYPLFWPSIPTKLPTVTRPFRLDTVDRDWTYVFLCLPNWNEGQEHLANLSARGELMTAAKSNHMVHDDEPELVIDAIRRLHIGDSAQVAPSEKVN